MKEIKFRAWDKINQRMICDCTQFSIEGGKVYQMLFWGNIKVNSLSAEFEIMQYTGLKDKNKDLTDIYEGDILGENGLIKGNIYETPKLLEEGTSVVIANMGTDEWRDSEQEAIRRGCEYAQQWNDKKAVR